MGEGLLSLVTATIRDLGLVVDKAVVDPSDKNVLATFYVTDFDQKKVSRVPLESTGLTEGWGRLAQSGWPRARVMRCQPQGGRGSGSHAPVAALLFGSCHPTKHTTGGGGPGHAQLTDVEDLTNIRICIATVVDQEVGGKMLAATPTPAAPEANAAPPAALTEKEKVRRWLVSV